MVGIVGPSVIIRSVKRAVAHGAYGSPGQFVEIGNQVGGDAAHFLVNLLRLHNAVGHRLPVGGGDAGEEICEVRSLLLVFRQGNQALRFAPLHVHENPPIVAACAPGFCFAPVHLVLGTGVNRVYPISNRALAQQIDRKGLILSEYPRGTGPDRNHFPSRNRIIAGLCRATVVIEAGSKSGALITAHVANDYGRDVYALPGSLDSPQSRGCLEMIAGGAQLILDEASLLQSLGAIPPLDAIPNRPASSSNLAATAPPAIALPPHLEPIFQAIPPEAIALDTLVQTTQLDTSSLLAALLELEMLGVVSQLPGMRYCRA